MNDGATSSYAMSLPTGGFFEIPMGCSMHSYDWIFQASFRKYRVYNWVAGSKLELPTLPVMDLGIMTVQENKMGTVAIMDSSR